jgi:hypothetical protein
VTAVVGVHKAQTPASVIFWPVPVATVADTTLMLARLALAVRVMQQAVVVVVLVT